MQMNYLDKKTLENLSGLKIRRGFDKLIPKATMHFNATNNLTEQLAKEIILFINKSNTRLHEAYWILRTDKAKNEYETELKKYQTNFVSAAYKHTNRKTVAKDFTRKHKSRGYSGYANIENRKIYCRSQIEFVCAYYLIKECKKLGYELEYEHSIFDIDGKFNYKPDYCIFVKKKLTKIIEAKSSRVFLDSEQYRVLKNYFDRLNIVYEVFYDYKFVLKTDESIKEALETWKAEAHIEKDMKGSNNPRYNVPASEKTKRLIGEKARKRFSDFEYRKNNSEKNCRTAMERFISKHKTGVLRSYTDDRGHKLCCVVSTKDRDCILTPTTEERKSKILNWFKNEDNIN